MFTITVGQIGTGRTQPGMTLAAREITIGRSPDSDLVLTDDRVSRTHCRLVAIEGGVLVLDAGSSNGTLINDTPVDQPSLLTFDDTLVIGPYRLRVRSLIGRGTTGYSQEPHLQAFAPEMAPAW